LFTLVCAAVVMLAAWWWAHEARVPAVQSTQPLHQNRQSLTVVRVESSRERGGRHDLGRAGREHFGPA
jgi:hypothetical protein